MPYNYSKLLGRIVECCGTQANFAEKIGLSERTVSLKLNGKRAWNNPKSVLLARFSASPQAKSTNIFLPSKFNNIELRGHSKQRR